MWAMDLLFMTNDTKQRPKKKKKTISRERKINRKQEYSQQIFIKVAIPKELVQTSFLLLISEFEKGQD